MWTKSRGSRALTVASVPTGMKAGVSTFPCTVEKTPARAAPDVASISNEKLIVFEANETPAVAGAVYAGTSPRRESCCPCISISDNDHCIAVGIKPVPLGDRLLVRAHG